MLGILTGLREEAKLAVKAFPDALIVMSLADEEGAKKALQTLLNYGVTELLSFGCAGGLDPSLPPGTIIVPDHVWHKGQAFYCTPKMKARFSNENSLNGGILHSPKIIETAAEKKSLREQTGCSAVDMESGIVAQSGLPFAVLRVICDDAAQDLPPAASEGLKEGEIYIPGLLASLCRKPSQLGTLIKLGQDATKARKRMAEFLLELS
ncbi:phosphorylase family protein [Aristophania vespae]|uniref:phosphorylase family protein n=1 Tax=Aristophania vespae TaxID=2697033 RepID=UPI002351AFA7|nr:hypothetical protein [Aristophania vespae]UMM64724.1 hypothetical protein DM15PD_17430 [Aristophania vespae]